MPGSIRVSVLEAFDLPTAIADGEDVAIKVAVGTSEYQTAPSKAIGGKTTPWSLDFVFPVLNLRDNLVVVLLDENGEAISKNEIDTPSIVEQGSFDVNLVLNGGGNVHLSLSFVLTDEERRRIDVMRAAALKRREQAASKLSASMQLVPVEGEGEDRSSELHSAPVGSLEKDIEKASVANDPTLRESDVLESTMLEPVLQDTHQEPLICIQPVGKLDNADSTNQDVPDKTLYGSVEGACDSYINSSDCRGKSDKPTCIGSGNQEPIGIADSTASDNNSPAAAGQMSMRASVINETGDLERSHLPRTASEESRELLEELPDANAKATPSSVKAKIKAFEKTRPQGATKQSPMLSSSSKTQKFSPRSKSIPHNKSEDEAEEVAITKEPFHDRNEQLEPPNPMEGVEPNKRVIKGNVASLVASEAGYTSTKEWEHLYEIEPRRTEADQLEPVSHTDCAKPNNRNSEVVGTSRTDQKPLIFNVPAQSVDSLVQDGNLEYQATVAEQPKDNETRTSSMEENRNINVMGLSKQILSGAVSGAVVIAAGVLLWAANPKRRNSSLQQRSKQRKRK